MARPFWQLIRDRIRERNPFDIETYDPRDSVMVDGVDVTVGGQIPLSETEAGRSYQAEQQAKDFQRRRQAVDSFQHGYPQAFKRSEWEQPVPTPKPEPSVEEDPMKKLLQNMFYMNLMAGGAEENPDYYQAVSVGGFRDFAPLPKIGRW
jgi:hypothetical protein